MLANLRLNKKITKELNNLPKEGFIPTSTQIKWHFENTTKVFGNAIIGFFTRKGLLLHYTEKNIRLFYVDTKGNCQIYLIEDLESFLKKVPMKIMPYEDDEVYNILKTSQNLPLTGVITVEDEILRVYDHKNY